jgi:hypothetical protein
MHDQSASLDLLFGDALGSEKFLERIAAVRRVAEPEGLDRPPCQAAVPQIGPCLRAASRLKLILEEARRHLHHVEEIVTLALAPLGFGVRCRQRHAGNVGDLLDSLVEAQAIQFHQEAEMIARDAAAEAMIAALAILAVEARRLLAMEWAAGPIVAATGIGLLPVPGHATADDLRDGHPVAQLVEELLGKAHGASDPVGPI